jgi:hypothetical protein
MGMIATIEWLMEGKNSLKATMCWHEFKDSWFNRRFYWGVGGMSRGNEYRLLGNNNQYYNDRDFNRLLILCNPLLNMDLSLQNPEQ